MCLYLLSEWKGFLLFCVSTKDISKESAKWIIVVKSTSQIRKKIWNELSEAYIKEQSCEMLINISQYLKYFIQV